MSEDVPVVKLLMCMRRLPHLDRAQFQSYWYDVHAPFVKTVAEALGLRKYVQCHAVNDAHARTVAGMRGCPPGFDGVAELWFDTRGPVTEAWKARAREANAALLEDEKRFIDLAASPLFYVQERPIFERAGGMVHDYMNLRAG